MIRPLRQRHRRALFALGIFLPLALVAGLAARRPVPPAQSGMEKFTTMSPQFERMVWAKRDLWLPHIFEADLFSDTAQEKKFAVRIWAGNEIVKPDVLVYWASGNLKDAGLVPANAVLLGALAPPAPTLFPLPDDVTSKSMGVLLLYSLADHEVVAVSKPLEFVNPGISP